VTAKRQGEARLEKKKPVRKVEAGGSLQIQATNPELFRVLFSRSQEVAPQEVASMDHTIEYSLQAVRLHSRHLGLELSVEVTDVPWLENGAMVVSYRIVFLIRGRASDAHIRQAVSELATRVGPPMLFPFLREKVYTITAAAGREIMLPMMNWRDAFDGTAIPDTEVEAPPEFLEFELDADQQAGG
jgi:preprotein translocase subunit SecB